MHYLKAFFIVAYFTTQVVTSRHDFRHLSGFSNGHSYPKTEHRNPPDVATFLSTNQTFSVVAGEDATFPCNVQKRNDEYKMIFKFIPTVGDDRIIYAGSSKVTHFPRLRKKEFSFTLKNIRKTDAGLYICRFETNPAMQLIHKLDVRYPAEVRRVGPKFQTVTKGARVILQCLADGNPLPEISWSRNQEPLAAGAYKVEGEIIVLKSVDIFDEGKYICRASNRIGSASSSSITLRVEYKPEITTNQSIVFTKGRVEAHILCIVHGRPPPSVKWLRGDALVSSNKHVITHDGSSKHTLKITHVTEDDFANYTCRARNSHGEVSESIVISGLPHKPVIVSSRAGLEKTYYNLSFETASFATIRQYRLRYRKAPLDNGKREAIPWVDFLYTPNKANLIRTVGTPSGSGAYVIRHLIRDLEPADDYEAIVMVENKFGWSNESDVFRFYTRKKISMGLSTSGSPTSSEMCLMTLILNGISLLFLTF